MKNHVYLLFEVELKLLEEILKEQAHQLASEFESFVAIVVLVVKLGGVKARFDNSANHQSHIAALCKIRHVLTHWNVCQDYVLKNIFHLCDSRPGFAGIGSLMKSGRSDALARMSTLGAI